MDANRTRSRTVSVEAKPEPITIICDSQQLLPLSESPLKRMLSATLIWRLTETWGVAF